jgi:hypothetical protein
VLKKNDRAVSVVLFIRPSLQDVHEMNAYRADHVHLSVRTIQLENSRKHLAKIWHGLYANGGYPEIVRFSFLQLVISTRCRQEPMRWE